MVFKALPAWMSLVFLLVVSAPLAKASDYQSPRTMGLGGAGHAAPLLNDALYLNPSYTAFLPSYSLSFNYLWYGGGNANPDGSNSFHGHDINAALQDGRSDLFQAGVGYTQTETERMIHVGASHQIIKQLGVGIGAKFNFPNDNSYSLIRDSIFSVTGAPAQWFQAAFIIDNIFETDAGVSRGYYREFVLGTKFNVIGAVLIYFDPHFVPNYSTSYGHEFGIEFPLLHDFYLRGGLFQNAWIPFESARGRGWTYGAGWIGPRLSLDFGVSNPNAPIPATAFNIGGTAYF